MGKPTNSASGLGWKSSENGGWLNPSAWIGAAAVALGAILLLLPAMWNGFPLMYSDTGAYLATAFEGKVPMARPTGYGLFIRYTALGDQVWLTLAMQALMFSWLVFRTVRVLLPRGRRLIGFGLGMVGSVGLTGIGWYAGQIMPDIFTGLMALGFFLVVFDDELRWWGRLGIAALLFVMGVSHYSHPALLLGLVACLAVFGGIQWIRRRGFPSRFWRMGWVLLAAFGSILFFYASNAVNGLGWRMTRSAHVFTMARLSETGLLADYLHETCPERHWSLCPYADSLPNSTAAFIWHDDSPFKKTGYWEESQPGYDSLLNDFFGRRKYLMAYLGECMKAGWAQMSAVSVGEGLAPNDENSSPYKFFERRLPEKIPEYRGSVQFNREISFEFDTWVLWVTMALSGIVLVVVSMVYRRRIPAGMAWFVAIAVLSYAINAVLTGALANVYARLQSRIAWLILFASAILFVEFIGKKNK
ncbi:MAG: hypothetical protein U0176_06295 [Bacteroidia bacterium]